MTCREFADLLIDMVGNELSPEMRETIRQHMCECPPCEVNLQTYELTIIVGRRLPRAPMPDHLFDRLQAALKAEQAAAGDGGSATA